VCGRQHPRAGDGAAAPRRAGTSACTPAAVRVDPGHWDEVGAALSLGRRQQDAVERAHRRQLLAAGRERERREEFQTALEIRTAVVIGTADDAGATQ
jgi:hypothetical protein